MMMEFWNALHLRYSWKLQNTPGHCICEVYFFQTMQWYICQHEGLTFVCHSDLQNITTEWLSKVCYDVAIESPLQLLTREVIEPKTANFQDKVRADIHE